MTDVIRPIVCPTSRAKTPKDASAQDSPKINISKGRITSGKNNAVMGTEPMKKNFATSNTATLTSP